MHAVLKFAVAFLAVAAIGIAAVSVSAVPGSAGSARVKLEQNALESLGVDAAQWTSLRMDGQKAVLAGEAPNARQRDAVISRIQSSTWAGGLAVGGVTVVDASEVMLAAPALHSEATDLLRPAPDTIESIIAEVEDEAPAEAVPAAVAETPAPDPPADPPQEDAAAAADACITDLRALVDSRTIRFDSARTDIDNPSRAFLREIAEALAGCPQVRLSITGHTDSSGNAARNQQLSSYRADAVRAFLISVGTPADRLRSNGAGASRPLASNQTRAGRERNRRIELEIVTAE